MLLSNEMRNPIISQETTSAVEEISKIISDKPLVSIIIPNYNRAHLLPETLDSLIQQTYSNWEAVIVDDCSTDDSIDVLESFAKRDKRIKYISRNRLPKGAPTCRNLGIENATGEFIIFLDSDDILAPYCLNIRIESFKANPVYDFLVFPMLIFNECPGDTSLLWNVNTAEDDLNRFLRNDTPWSVTGPIWKKEGIKKIGGWDEDALTWQDWEWHIKAIIHGCTYKKVDALPDSFVRRGANERISLGDIAPLRFHSRLRLFSTIYSLLAKNGKLNKSNRYNLANLFFSHSVKSAMIYYKESLAEDFSLKIIDMKLVPVMIAYLQAFYIKLLLGIKRRRLRFLSTLVYHIFYLFLPNYLVRSNSKRDCICLNAKDFEQVREMLAKS
jgi:glycosyltransferase involved in cell wall biosynthesis